MRRLALGLLVVLAALAPTGASAHPLGNFTVNHYARLEPAADQLRVVYVLDMAEIPTFQDKPRLEADASGYAVARAEEIRSNLHLSVNGRAAELRLLPGALSLTQPAGAGGLPTVRMEATYVADVPGVPSGEAPVDVVFRDDTDPTRIGWREIVARPVADGAAAGAGAARIVGSSVPATDVTDELRTYPEDLLSSPLNVRAARLSFVTAAAASGDTSSPAPATRSLPAASGGAVLERARSAFAELASGSELTPAFIVFAIGISIVLGAAHALQPGHGKTIVAAYLVGSRGTARHALFLGATVTATHTAGVYALGVVTLFLSQYIVPERLYPILEVASGALVLAIGGYLLVRRAQAAIGHGHSHDGHAHQHHHEHTLDHDDSERHTDPHVERHTDSERHVERHTDSERHVERHADSERHIDRHAERHIDSERHTDPHVERHADSERHTDPHVERHADSEPHTGRHVERHGGHSHVPPGGERVSWKSLLALGVSGGLLPCPEALMVLLITIAAHRVLFGLLLIVSFSSGLAAVLVGFGLLLVYAGGLFRRVNVSSGLVRRVLPVASALAIVLAGSVITVQALPQVL